MGLRLPLVGLERDIEGTARRSGLRRWGGSSLNCGVRILRRRTRLDLGINAPQQRPDVEIEQEAVGIDHSARLRPWRQSVERTLFQRLHYFGAGR
jgi:hypothetical protein